MRYSIQQMASLLGITTHKLRHYQKIGIIRPQIDRNSGYRYYSVLDTRRFNLACFYSSIGYALHEIVDILDKQSTNLIVDSLSEKIIELEKEVILKQRACKRIQSLQKELLSLESSLNCVKKIHLPAMYRLEISTLENPQCHPDLAIIKEQLLQYTALIQWVSRIPRHILCNRNQNLVYHYGIHINKEDADALGLDCSKLEYIDEGDYLYTVFEKHDRSAFNWQTLDVLLDYVDKNEVDYFQDAYSSCIHSRVENDDYQNFHYILLKL